MKRFRCPNCDAAAFFDTHACIDCGAEVAYDPDADGFVSHRGQGCANRLTVESCNWVRAAAQWCTSCARDVDHGPTRLRAPFQNAKRRALRQLRLSGVSPDADPPLHFALRESTDTESVTIGHAHGLITLDATEGDPAALASARSRLGEPYRTPLGHVRHELGHWYWEAFRGETFTTGVFRTRFGDERTDYSDALRRHYDRSDDGTWRDRFVSFYAAAHPWEDFAESFAHCLHLLDTVETARAHGGSPPPDTNDFDRLYAAWAEVAVLINELNRSMGTPDAYPFAPSPEAVAKIRFVHDALGRH